MGYVPSIPGFLIRDLCDPGIHFGSPAKPCESGAPGGKAALQRRDKMIKRIISALPQACAQRTGYESEGQRFSIPPFGPERISHKTGAKFSPKSGAPRDFKLQKAEEFKAMIDAAKQEK